MDADDLRDWTGNSTLIEAYPVYEGDYLRGNEGGQPYAGWHWGNQGGVSSAPIEKPHLSGWRPLLECEFDLAYSPLMELDYGQGRVIICTLDLEDHVGSDPAAKRMAEHVVDYALHSPLSPRVSKVVYLGGATGAAWLDKTGVSYQKSDTLDTSAGLVIIGTNATVDAAALNSYLEQGGKAFFLPRQQTDGALGTTLKTAPDQFAGSLSAPDWLEARGLSASDLRWRSYAETNTYLLSGGADIGADGLLGRKVVGKGVAIFCQVDPDILNAEREDLHALHALAGHAHGIAVVGQPGRQFQGGQPVFPSARPRGSPGSHVDGAGRRYGRASSRAARAGWSHAAGQRTGRLLLSRLSHRFPDGG